MPGKKIKETQNKLDQVRANLRETLLEKGKDSSGIDINEMDRQAMSLSGSASQFEKPKPKKEKSRFSWGCLFSCGCKSENDESIDDQILRAGNLRIQ